jgi:LPXTG-site transpeptidase (sortase) family protein
MPRPLARFLIVAAALVLIAVGVVAARDARSDPRADLVGPTVRTEASSTTTSSAPVAAAGPTTTTTPATTTTAAPAPVPNRIRIPAIGVDAPVVPVGLNPDGSMEVPAASDVGWYELGVRPGGPEGSSVLAAHVDYAGQRGAFYDLRSLEVGAELEVTGPDGLPLRYVVNERLQVDKDELPTQELFRVTGTPTLTLITCGGSFDRSVRHYEDNIVVRAVPLPAAAA